MDQKINIRSFRDAWLADFLSTQRHIERSLLKSITRYQENWTSLMLQLLIGIYVPHQGTGTKSYRGNCRNTPPLE